MYIRIGSIKIVVTIKIVLDYLIDKAEKDPKKVIEMDEGEEWKMQLFVLDAIDRGVIRRSDNIFKYNDL